VEEAEVRLVSPSVADLLNANGSGRLSAPTRSVLMTKEAIKEKVEAIPFRPFTLRLTDGRTCEVPARDFASLAPNGRTLAVWTAEGGMRLLDVALIVEIETTPT
jgi:hypothetical protein